LDTGKANEGVLIVLLLHVARVCSEWCACFS